MSTPPAGRERTRGAAAGSPPDYGPHRHPRCRCGNLVLGQRGESVASLAQRMAFDDEKEARFRVLNGLGANEQLQAGQQVKLVIKAR